MEPAEGARSFLTSGNAYDRYMGRYSRPLASVFADVAGVKTGMNVLDVGCGPGALTGVLVERLGADAVCAFDPSAPFVADCVERHPGVDVRLGRAEAIPFEDGLFDGAMAQLVLHFVSDPAQVCNEMQRVLRPGGIVAACVWDFTGGMEMLRRFWDAALAVEPDAPDEAGLSFGRQGEIAELFARAGFDDVAETTMTVTSTYAGFDELWSGFLAGIGPAGSYCVSLPDDRREDVRHQMLQRLGSPTGSLTLSATARCALGRVAG